MHKLYSLKTELWQIKVSSQVYKLRISIIRWQKQNTVHGGYRLQLIRTPEVRKAEIKSHMTEIYTCKHCICDQVHNW